MKTKLIIFFALFIPFAAVVGYLGMRASASETTWRPDAKRWAHAPLLVYAQDFPEATQSAADLWNRSAGCDMIRVTSDASKANFVVKVTDGAPCGMTDAAGMLPEHAGGAYIKGECAEVHVAYPGDLRMQLVIISHEIGHLLGLEDDERGCWIMRGSAQKVYDCATLRASDADSKAINSAYCRRSN